MCDDEQLRAWLDLVCQEPPTPPLMRQKALSRLLLCIQRSPRLWRDPHQDYAYALNQTLEWVCRNLAQFNAETDSVAEDLLRWVNGHLKWRIQDLKLKKPLGAKDDRVGKDAWALVRLGLQPVELDKPMPTDQGGSAPVGSLVADPNWGESTLLDRLIETLQQNQQARLGQVIRDYLTTDPDGLLHACCPRKFPDCHCHTLVRQLHLTEPPETLRAIASQTGMPEQTLYSHWRSKCLPLLQIVALRHDPQVLNYAQHDPGQQLQSCHPEGLAPCSCLELSRRLLLSEVPTPLKAVAKALGVKESTLTNHWQTQCLPLLKTHRL